ncbi:MAG: hypothetical protein MI974_14035 [Chitinophagales bacterium]|nr:hypothetical protein [Chitinophagales bacterium]
MSTKLQNSSPCSEYEFWQIKQKLEEKIQKIKGQDFSDFIKKNKFEHFVYEELGVCGGAYVLANKSQKELLYLHNRDIQKDLLVQYPNIPFIEIPYQFHHLRKYSQSDNEEKQKRAERYLRVLDHLYIGARDRQPLIHETESSPEFYLNLPHWQSPEEKKKLLPFEQYLTKKDFDIIYVTVGEVLFHLYAWRILFRHAQLKGLVDGYIQQKPTQEVFTLEQRFWEKIKEVPFLPEYKWSSNLERLEEKAPGLADQWSKMIRKTDGDPLRKEEGYSFYMEYHLLGLVEEDTDHPTRELLSMVRFAIHIAEVVLGWTSTTTLNKTLENITDSSVDKEEIRKNAQALSMLFLLERRLDIYFQEKENTHQDYIPILDKLDEDFKLERILDRLMRAYLFKIAEQEKEEKALIKDLMSKIHEKARFPILHYFYELAAGDVHHPKEHLALCIWHTHSKDNKIEIKTKEGETKEESATGFVLLTIKPIWQVNEGSNFIKNGKSIHCMKELSEEAYVRIFRIYEFFRSLARPVIDAGFYGNLIKKEIERQLYTTDITAFSHEMSKIVDNIFELSNVSLNQFFKSKVNDVINDLKPYLQNHKDFNIDNVKNWRLIPNIERFNSWSLALKVWSGRRGQFIFDIEEGSSFNELLKECNRYSLHMRIGEEYKGRDRADNLQAVVDYQVDFEKKYKEKQVSNSFHIKANEDTLKELRFKKLPQGEKDRDDAIYNQNALLRFLLAAMTNIHEHTTGSYILGINWYNDPQDLISEEIITLCFLNPFKEKEIHPKSLGTKPVLQTCLNLLQGTLTRFDPIEDIKQEDIDIQQWIHMMPEKITKENGIWVTRCHFPLEKVFEK